MKKQSKKPAVKPAKHPGRHKHSSLGLLIRALKLSVSNMWRNKFLSIATILVMAIMIFIFNIILALNFIASSALTELTQKVDIIVYLDDKSEYHQIKQMIDELAVLDGVKSVDYTSKSEALEIVAKTRPNTAEFLRKYGMENPLPPSISIITEKPEFHITVQQFLNQEKYRPLLSNIISEAGKQSSVTQSATRNLVNLSKVTNQITFWIFTLFIVGSLLVISNSIQLTIYNRKKEIYIMKLVGATKNFIRLPFLFEGLFYGLISMLLAVILLLILAAQIHLSQITISEYLKDIPFVTILIVEFITAAVLGVLCSFTAVYRYLRTKLITD